MILGDLLTLLPAQFNAFHGIRSWPVRRPSPPGPAPHPDGAKRVHIGPPLPKATPGLKHTCIFRALVSFGCLLPISHQFSVSLALPAPRSVLADFTGVARLSATGRRPRRPQDRCRWRRSVYHGSWIRDRAVVTSNYSNAYTLPPLPKKTIPS